ncbi:MAG: carboxypeptidase regulatory-like domain-containing protein [Tepidisphaeraceae bacterium]
MIRTPTTARASPPPACWVKAAVTGRVIFNAVPPKLDPLRNKPCCPDSPETLSDESVIVGKDNGLANVFVYLENGPKTDGSSLPAALLDQKYCQYIPHVVGVVVNQPLTLRSSDPVPHNVKIKPPGEGERNYSMKAAGESEVTQLLRPGFATSHCDVHPWMTAVIGVFDNPFFAVTDKNGNFKIENVPDGTYTVIARHERYLKTPPQTITIAGGKAVSVDFKYEPPAQS